MLSHLPLNMIVIKFRLKGGKTHPLFIFLTTLWSQGGTWCVLPEDTRWSRAFTNPDACKPRSRFCWNQKNCWIVSNQSASASHIISLYPICIHLFVLLCLRFLRRRRDWLPAGAEAQPRVRRCQSESATDASGPAGEDKPRILTLSWTTDSEFYMTWSLVLKQKIPSLSVCFYLFCLKFSLLDLKMFYHVSHTHTL